VREHMSIVLRRLQGRRFVEFEDLFDPTRGAPVLVVTFIALLELAKETLVDIARPRPLRRFTCAWPIPQPEGKACLRPARAAGPRPISRATASTAPQLAVEQRQHGLRNGHLQPEAAAPAPPPCVRCTPPRPHGPRSPPPAQLWPAASASRPDGCATGCRWRSAPGRPGHSGP